MYVDNDPIVLAHARALLMGSPEGATAYIDADLRDTGKILDEAARILDFGKPVAVMLLGVLHCIPDEEDPAAIVDRLLAAVAPGSYLVVRTRRSTSPPARSARPCAATTSSECPAHGAHACRGRPLLRGPGPGGARCGATAPVAAGAG